jgi:dihydrofolate synthase/folylpolyglutamate synthase
MGDASGLLAAWLTRLESLSAHEIVLGLERVEVLLDRLDLPPPGTVLHVGGTNGKGSCVAMLESLLGAPDRRVGCYTSPHLCRYNERIRIDGEAADDAAIVAAFERVEAVRGDVPLTYFEYGTLAALVVFADRQVDVAILEVGMGGRLDAVNAVEPTAGLITNVALDHCDWLGKDIESIAAEKAGIMRTGKPIVYGDRAPPDAIRRRAAEVGAALQLAGRDYDWTVVDGRWDWRRGAVRLDGLALPALPGTHQLANAAAVLALLDAAGYGTLLTNERVDTALGRLRLDGRMQVLAHDPRWLLDIAHNAAAAGALAATLALLPRPGKTVAIFGLLDDKDVAGVVQPLAAAVDEWIVVTAESPRARPASELAQQVAELTRAPTRVAASVDAALADADAAAAAGDRILVTGSFYVVGPVLSELYSRRTS